MNPDKKKPDENLENNEKLKNSKNMEDNKNLKDNGNLNDNEKETIDELLDSRKYLEIVQYVHSLFPVRNKDSLIESIELGKQYYWEKLSLKEKAIANDIFGTAFLLYYDFENAANYFIDSNNNVLLKNTLELAKLYGKADAIKNISSYGIMNNLEELVVSSHEYFGIVAKKTIPHFPLLFDGKAYSFDESKFNHLTKEAGLNKKEIGEIIKYMDREGNKDSVRKLLLSYYSENPSLILNSKLWFEYKKGHRKDMDKDVEKICEKYSIKLVEKIQEGDSDDYYPKSANIYFATKDADAQDIVLKENIRYQIDFSTVSGYNMEKEIYPKIQGEGVPKYYGEYALDALEFIGIEKVSGENLSKYTEKNEKGNLLSLEDACDCIMKVASVIDRLHSKGIVYADIKDKNIIYDKGKADETNKVNEENKIGKESNVTLIDYGMASNRLYKDNAGEEFIHSIVSNAEYACPETILQSRMYKKSDVFQMGILLYKMVAGKHPFADGVATEDYMHKESELVAFSLSNLWNEPCFKDEVFTGNPYIKEVVSRMLNKDYTKRPDAAEVKIMLTNIRDKNYAALDL